MKNRILLWALVLTFLGGSFSWANEPRTLIKLDIEEKVDGHKSPYHISQYILLQYFYLHGFDVQSIKATPYDKKFKMKEKTQDFESWQKSLKGKKPDFIITGKAKASLGSVSRFYGSTVAFIYAGEIEIKIKDKDGKVLATLKDTLKFGASNRGVSPKGRAAKGCLKNLAFFLCDPLYRVKELQQGFKCDKEKLEKRLKAFQKHRAKLKESEKQFDKKDPKKPEKKPEKKPDGPF